MKYGISCTVSACRTERSRKDDPQLPSARSAGTGTAVAGAGALLKATF